MLQIIRVEYSKFYLGDESVFLHLNVKGVDPSSFPLCFRHSRAEIAVSGSPHRHLELGPEVKIRDDQQRQHWIMMIKK
jgi:hypothetical protein